MLYLEFNCTILLIRHKVIDAYWAIANSMIGLLSYNMYLYCIWMQKTCMIWVGCLFIQQQNLEQFFKNIDFDVHL